MLELAVGESATSYVSRLAAFECAPNARTFIRDMSLQYEQIAKGNEDALKELASFAGVDPEALIRHSPKWNTNATYRLGDELLATGVSPRTHYRVCPKCAAASLSHLHPMPPEVCIFSRAIWQISSLRLCPLHGVDLVNVKMTSKSEAHDFTMQIVDVINDLDELVECSFEREPTPFDTYLSARLTSRGTENWTDRIELTALEPSCLRFGLHAEHGPDAALHNLTVEQVWQARQRGFDLLAQGLPAIIDLARSLRLEPDCFILKHILRLRCSLRIRLG